MHAGALLALGADCPVGVKVLIEGQEECGDGGIEEFVKANAELLKADVIVISDVGNYALGVPTLTTSLRGMAACDVEVETLEGAVHSGMFGGPAPDALIALCRIDRDAARRQGRRGRQGPRDHGVRRRRLRRGRVPHRRRRAARRRPHRQRQHRPAAVRQAVDQRDRHRRPGGGRRRQRAHPQGPGARQRAPRARAGARGRAEGRQGAPRGGRPLERQGQGDARHDRRGLPRQDRRPGLRGGDQSDGRRLRQGRRALRRGRLDPAGRRVPRARSPAPR